MTFQTVRATYANANIELRVYLLHLLFSTYTYTQQCHLDDADATLKSVYFSQVNVECVG